MKLKGIKSAVGDFNGYRTCSAIIHLDLDTGEVWTNIYGGSNEYTQWNKSKIVAIKRRSNLYNEKTSMKELREICNQRIALELLETSK